MTGNELRQARLQHGWGQRELARRAGITHKAVQYWEAKLDVSARAQAVRSIADAYGWPTGELSDICTRARGGVLLPEDADTLLVWAAPNMSPALRKRLAYRRVLCGATTRKGTLCRAKSEPGRHRSRFHGGLSTGPKTEEGRKRIAEAQRKRLARVRASNLRLDEDKSSKSSPDKQA